MKTRVIALFAPIILGAFTQANAGDWPQWRGPDRTGVSKETGLLKEWPKDGPKLLWMNKNLGNGYSTPAIAGGRIYVQSNHAEDELAVALDEKTGKQIWSSNIGKVGKNRGPQYPGARGTPTVDGDNLYCLGSDGDLVCIERDQGKIKWHKQLKKEFGGKMGAWAYSESPLIDGDVLVCTPGGKEATLLALNKKDGSVIWKCAVPEGDEAAYASAIIAQAGDSKQYVQFLQKGLVGVDAKTGKFLWRFKKTIDIGANIPTPVFHDGYVFSSTGRNAGAVVRLTADNAGVSATEVWLNKAMTNSIGGVVLVDNHLYGTTLKGLFCTDFLTGKVKWQDRSVGVGAVCYADGNLYVRGEKGDVALVEATPEAYREKGRFKQPERAKTPAWPYPVVANGNLYLRDQNFLYCYEVKDPKTSARR
jgi:outer membrane protein assembly factor BamB